MLKGDFRGFILLNRVWSISRILTEKVVKSDTITTFKSLGQAFIWKDMEGHRSNGVKRDCCQ